MTDEEASEFIGATLVRMLKRIEYLQARNELLESENRKLREQIEQLSK